MSALEESHVQHMESESNSTAATLTLEEEGALVQATEFDIDQSQVQHMGQLFFEHIQQLQSFMSKSLYTIKANRTEIVKEAFVQVLERADAAPVPSDALRARARVDLVHAIVSKMNQIETAQMVMMVAAGDDSDEDVNMAEPTMDLETMKHNEGMFGQEEKAEPRLAGGGRVHSVVPLSGTPLKKTLPSDLEMVRRENMARCLLGNPDQFLDYYVALILKNDRQLISKIQEFQDERFHKRFVSPRKEIEKALHRVFWHTERKPRTKKLLNEGVVNLVVNDYENLNEHHLRRLKDRITFVSELILAEPIADDRKADEIFFYVDVFRKAINDMFAPARGVLGPSRKYLVRLTAFACETLLVTMVGLLKRQDVLNEWVSPEEGIISQLHWFTEEVFIFIRHSFSPGRIILPEFASVCKVFFGEFVNRICTGDQRDGLWRGLFPKWSLFAEQPFIDDQAMQHEVVNALAQIGSGGMGDRLFDLSNGEDLIAAKLPLMIRVQILVLLTDETFKEAKKMALQGNSYWRAAFVALIENLPNHPRAVEAGQ